MSLININTENNTVSVIDTNEMLSVTDSNKNNNISINAENNTVYTVSVIDTNQSISVTDNNKNTTISVIDTNQSISVTQPSTNVIQVNTLGPQGPQGPPGPPGIGSLSASYAISSSYALTASYLDNYIPPFPFTGSAQITGSLGLTGSLNVTAGITGSLLGTSSYATNALTASFANSSSISANTILQTGITSNATVGGATAPRTFDAGTSLESIIRTMLITYIAPTIGSFTLFNGGTSILSSNTVVEVSSSYTFNTASFTATADNPNGRFAYSASFTASGASTGNFNYFFGNNVLGSSNNLGLGGSQIVNNSTNSTVTFTLRGINPETNAIISQTRTATYVYPYYYGMSAVDYSTTGNVSASLTQLTQTQGTKTLAINGSTSYVYYCYPSSYPDLTSIKDGNNFEVLSSFDKYTRNQDGAPGKWAGISYKIYRSKTLTNVSPAQNYIFTH
jgi:hypothetical protein